MRYIFCDFSPASFYLTTEDRHQMVINVNITCLLALASVYLAVATSLPSTSSTKPVEVFLIYNLAYPFLTILLAVAIQVLSSTDELSILFLSVRFWRLRLRNALKRKKII